VPSQTNIESFEKVDGLLLTRGGGDSLNSHQAAELISMLEPKIVIPMHYQIPGLNRDLEDVERFLKELGVTRPEEKTNLKISSSTLTEETQVVLLTPKSRK
jgi:L-ascorbate metabolism protein UlaG (beta-lactamase superfamily)